MLIDDDRAMLDSTSQWLALSGVDVVAYIDPVAALQALKKKSPCVLVTDIRMPNIDGMEILKQTLNRDTDAQVIIITGHGDVPLAVEAMKTGAFQFITKPFVPEELLAHVRSAQAKRMRLYRKDHSPQMRALQAQPGAEQAEADRGLTATLEDHEREVLIASLKKNNGKIAQVLDELAIPRRTLNAKLSKYGIIAKDYRD